MNRPFGNSNWGQLPNIYIYIHIHIYVGLKGLAISLRGRLCMSHTAAWSIWFVSSRLAPLGVRASQVVASVFTTSLRPVPSAVYNSPNICQIVDHSCCWCCRRFRFTDTTSVAPILPLHLEARWMLAAFVLPVVKTVVWSSSLSGGGDRFVRAVTYSPTAAVKLASNLRSTQTSASHRSA